MSYFAVLMLALALTTTSERAIAGDPDIVSDFIMLPNNTKVDGKYFTYTKFCGIFERFPETFKVTKASSNRSISNTRDNMQYLHKLIDDHSDRKKRANIMNHSNTEKLNTFLCTVFPRNINLNLNCEHSKPP